MEYLIPWSFISRNIHVSEVWPYCLKYSMCGILQITVTMTGNSFAAKKKKIM